MFIFSTSLSYDLTISSDSLRQRQKSERYKQIERPVGCSRHAVAKATRPQRVNLGVDGPRHRTHAWKKREKNIENVLQVENMEYNRKNIHMLFKAYCGVEHLKLVSVRAVLNAICIKNRPK